MVERLVAIGMVALVTLCAFCCMGCGNCEEVERCYPRENLPPICTTMEVCD